MREALAKAPDFRRAVLQGLGAGWQDDGDLIRSCTVREVPNQAAFVEAGGTRQRERSGEPLQSGFYDLARYRASIDRALGFADGASLAFDLGCGDGRGVDLLLQANVQRIVAVDFNGADLTRLSQGLAPAARGRVVAVCASVTESLPLDPQADLAIMLEVLSTLADAPAALAAAGAILKPGGILLLSDPAPAGLFVHALLNRDWDNVRLLAEHGRYADRVGTRRIELSLRPAREIERLAAAVGLEAVERECYPARSALLLHALKQAAEVTAQGPLIELCKGWEDNDIARMHVLLLKKTRAGAA